jgi:hypothetical protein
LSTNEREKEEMKLFGISRENNKIVVHEFETDKHLSDIFLLSLFSFHLSFFLSLNLFFPFLGIGVFWIGE